MTESGPLSSFPDRPLTAEEIDAIEASDRVLAIQYDDETVRSTGDDLFVYNCVFVMEETVTAAIYREDDEEWHRAYREPAPTRS